MKSRLFMVLLTGVFLLVATGSGWAHTGDIPLKDRTGAQITVDSTVPYSPEQTCGGCHDFDLITMGYHFQQGKGFSNTDIRVADNYNPTKPWLLSDGMFGKW
jgi:hypothetical protein